MFYNKKKFFFILLLFITLTIHNQAKIENAQKHNFNPIQKKTQKNNSPETVNNSDKEIYQWLRTLSEVVSLVKEKAFRNVDFSSFIQESLKAAVPQTIDPHSAFFSQESYKTTIESTSGEFSGIGVSIISKTPEDDALVIVDVIQSGPADKSGLKGADKILEINGEKLRGLSTDEVITKLKGKVGTEIKVKVIRNKKPFEFKIKREIIKDQTSICYYFKNQNIYYLSLKIFAETASRQISKLLKKANEGECKGIILDLRRNPGGILDSAPEIASFFIPKGSLVVITKDKTNKTIYQYHTKTNPILKSDIPIFILIDNFTASASEILAGCLRYYSEKSFSEKKKDKKFMVFLVGTPSFGKGSVQEVIPISNGCALKLTTMLYYLPNDESIQAVGIKPDFIVKPKIIPSEEIKWINELYGKETSLKQHITFKEAQKNNIIENKEKENEEQAEEENKEKSWEEKQKDSINQDVQIKACVNMINLLDLTKKYDPKQVSTRQRALNFLRKNYLTDQMVELEKIK